VFGIYSFGEVFGLIIWLKIMMGIVFMRLPAKAGGYSYFFTIL